MENETPSHGSEDIFAQLARYHEAMLAEHGTTPGGVAWNSDRAQRVRFEQLVKVVRDQGAFSVNDFGCGYGALYPFLQSRFPVVDYRGFDVSEEMVRAAQQCFPQGRFHVGAQPREAADYAMASGILSMRFDHGDSEWSAYVESTLRLLDRTSRKGFAFNSLTIYSDPDKMRPELYYPDPCRLFDICKREFSRNVALLHDYDLYDFTILVRKDS